MIDVPQVGGSAHPIPLISVVVCTYDRPLDLGRCLDSLCQQTIHAHEVIVVDNGVQPARTQEVVHRAGAIRWRYLRETTPGLSRARNRGWQAADGVIVAFIDDDAMADSRWVEGIGEAFACVTPSPGCVGGRVEPIWDSPRPVWLSDDLARGLSLVDWSPEPRLLQESEWLAGCNMAVPKVLLAAMGGFDERLGRAGGRLISQEETVLHKRLRRAGHPLYYDSGVIVRHHIPAGRLTKRWFLRRAYHNGVSVALAKLYLTPVSPRRRLRMAATTLGRKVFTPGAVAGLLAATDEADELRRRCVFLGWLGYALAMLGLAR